MYYITDEQATLGELKVLIENTLKNRVKKDDKIYFYFSGHGIPTNEGETYIYNVELTDLLGKTDKTINMQILMQLKDDRDFVMSFSIK